MIYLQSITTQIHPQNHNIILRRNKLLQKRLKPNVLKKDDRKRR